MIFNTIEEYDHELNEMRSRLEGMEERMKQYPERTGIQLNYKSFKQLHDIISKDREGYLKMIEENTNFHVTCEDNPEFSLPLMSEIFESMNDFTFNLANLLKNINNLKFNPLLPVKKVSSGSLHLSFSMGDEKTDLREIQLNHELFETLFDIFECSEEDIPKLNDKLNDECIDSYKDFLNVLIKHKLDIVLENSSRNVELTHYDALKVYNILSH
jgi:hypothetical protein